MFILETSLKLTAEIWPGTLGIVKYSVARIAQLLHLISNLVLHLERENSAWVWCAGFIYVILYILGIVPGEC